MSKVRRFKGTEKPEARKWVAQEFYRMTGLPSIPLDRQFWELCYKQLDPTSSFHQFTTLNLFSPKQYRGVDRDENIIAENNKFHQNQVCFMQGAWDKVIHQSFINLEFNPQLIYLDTEVMPELASHLTAYTMPRCPVGTVLIVNMVITNRYHSKSLEMFINLLGCIVPEHSLERWRKNAKSFEYVGVKGVTMAQVSLYKGTV